MADGSIGKIKGEADQPLARPFRPNSRSAPAGVWEQVRIDYLSGVSAAACCRRHGVGMSALRDRAAREGWRRADQAVDSAWAPPSTLDPWDEGAELESQVGGDLDQVDYGHLAYVADRRMMRAVLRGEAAAALRWRRVRDVMAQEQRALEAFIEHEEAYERMMAKGEAILAANTAPDAPVPDSPDSGPPHR